jgi:photosystem II stability/assembly factor-like uncharacterized protein
MNITIKRLLFTRWLACSLVAWAAFQCPSYGQWVPLGPYGGGTQVLTTVPSRPGTLIAGTRNALLYMSTDNAVSWQTLPFPKSLQSTLNTIVVDPCDPSAIYVGVSDSGAASGLLKSTDGGRSWDSLEGFNGEAVTALAAAPYTCGTIAAGTYSGVMLSADSGTTWTRISPADHPGLRPVVSLAFDGTSTDILYAGTPKLPWKTSNRGKTWESIHFGIQDDSDIFSIVPYGSRVFIGACSGVYRSIDGVKWSKVLGIPGTSRRTYVVKPDPRNPRVLYAGTSMGLYKSTDAGMTWTRKSSLPVRAVAIDPDNTRNLFLGTDGGILKSQDGGETLKASNSGFANRKLEGFQTIGATLLTSAVYDVGTSSAIFASGDFGRTWSSPEEAAAPNEPISTFARTANSVFAAGSNHLFRSTTRGKRWVALNTPFKGAITALETLPQSGDVLIATHAELFVSSDEGISWLNVELPSAISDIRLLRFSPDGRTWGIATRDSVFLSNNKGANWSKLKTPQENGAVYDFAINTRNAILLGTLRGVAISLDGGLQWRMPAQGISPGTVDSVLWHPAQKNLMYAVQHGLLYRSSDGGTVWERIKTDELGGDSILNLHWASDHSKLYAVTFARGIFVQNLSLANSVATGGSDH